MYTSFENPLTNFLRVSTDLVLRPGFDLSSVATSILPSLGIESENWVSLREVNSTSLLLGPSVTLFSDGLSHYTKPFTGYIEWLALVFVYVCSAWGLWISVRASSTSKQFFINTFKALVITSTVPNVPVRSTYIERSKSIPCHPSSFLRLKSALTSISGAATTKKSRRSVNVEIRFCMTQNNYVTNLINLPFVNLPVDRLKLRAKIYDHES